MAAKSTSQSSQSQTGEPPKIPEDWVLEYCRCPNETLAGPTLWLTPDTAEQSKDWILTQGLSLNLNDVCLTIAMLSVRLREVQY